MFTAEKQRLNAKGGSKLIEDQMTTCLMIVSYKDFPIRMKQKEAAYDSNYAVMTSPIPSTHLSHPIVMDPRPLPTLPPTLS